jgi:signal transduction histidine kinase
MVRDLLDTSRLETHMLALERRTVELRPLVSEIVERARELMHEHAVRVELPEDLPMVHADPMRVEQVLLNLLSNAAKYSTPATEITVEAKALPTEVELAVTNQGAGLTEWEISRVFSRFYRSKHARSVEGLGIGLYIAKGLVEAQGGRIWIESEPGRFATFRFTLPRIDAPPEVDDQVDQNLSPKPATG